MRYAVFTDVHANLEALEAVLAKIDELAKEKPIEQIWFLGDLVGYGPNPNECIEKLRKRTDVIIAGNHDWAAVGKLDLDDFSSAARISAEWTAEQLTAEHREFLRNLPERMEIGECTLVHGSPYGPLWEYLTSEMLAERSFQYFNTRYCFVGHTHVPVIFQQPDVVANSPTLPLVEEISFDDESEGEENGTCGADDEEKIETAEMAAVQPTLLPSKKASHAESAYADPDTGQAMSEADANTVMEAQMKATGQLPDSEDKPLDEEATVNMSEAGILEEVVPEHTGDTVGENEEARPVTLTGEDASMETEVEDAREHEATEDREDSDEPAQSEVVTPESDIQNAEDRLNEEIEELLSLLGLSESLVQVTNEMSVPPEGHWEVNKDYRAIINPGGVGQPRDGDPRAAFMIYDTQKGFEFYRIPYAFNKTQEKIIKAGLPPYLAIRLAYGR